MTDLEYLALVNAVRELVECLGSLITAIEAIAAQVDKLETRKRKKKGG